MHLACYCKGDFEEQILPDAAAPSKMAVLYEAIATPVFGSTFLVDYSLLRRLSLVGFGFA